MAGPIITISIALTVNSHYDIDACLNEELYIVIVGVTETETDEKLREELRIFKMEEGKT